MVSMRGFDAGQRLARREDSHLRPHEEICFVLFIAVLVLDTVNQICFRTTAEQGSLS